MSKNNVRIAIRDSTDSHNVAFFDNKAGIKYKSANLHRFLAGSASILTIRYNSKDIDSIRSGCKLAFRYKNRDYWLNVMSFEKKGFEVELTAYSLGLELNNETRGEHKPAIAMSIAEYVAYYDPEHALTIGVNEVSDKRIKLEWTGTDTILARLFSVANSFGAELDFNVELNDDYSLKRQVLNIYKKGNLGTNKVSQPVRVGKELKVINYSDNIKELRTAVRATGKDGLTIDGLNKKIYDNNKELLYYSSGMTVYAPQSRDRFPSVGKGSNDNWIVEDLGETQYETKEALWGYMYGEIQKKSLPEITYEVEGAIDAGIGDTQTLIDDIHFEPALYVQARVSELEDDILAGKVTNSTFINFERKYSQIADELQKRVNELVEASIPYTIKVSSDNGTVFKNATGTSTFKARVFKGEKEITSDVSWRWALDGNVTVAMQYLARAENIDGTAVLTVSAYIGNNEVATTEITLTNVNDGVQGPRGPQGPKGDRGEDGIAGKDGVGLKSTVVTYGLSASETTRPTSWTEQVPALTKGKYLWTKTVWTYTDNTNETGYQKTYIAKDGNDGADGIAGKDGVGIKSTTITYASSTSGITKPTSGWSSTIPSVSAGNFLWTKTVWMYTDNTSETGYSVAKMGETGAKGDKGETGPRGPKGEQGIAGATGATGAQGPKGADGKTSYIHIKYSPVPIPKDSQITDTPNAYIGVYTDYNPNDSNKASAYTWSKWQGEDGAQGVQGPKGTDGKTSYIHFAYANSADGKTNFSTTYFSGALYVGTLTDYNSADSTTYSAYTWSRLKGDKGDKGDKGETGERGPQGIQGLQGPKGDQGIQGPKGADGKTQYTHIAYADNATGGGFSQTDHSKAYIGMYVDFTATDSKDPTKYRWSKWHGDKGATGAQGIQGPKGADGRTPYLHIAYANSADGRTDFSTSNSGNKRYLGTYTDYTQADSTDPSKYKWVDMVGTVKVGGRNLAQKTSKDWSKPFTGFSGIQNTCPNLYKVITDGLVVGDTLKTRIVLKYTDIKPVSGKTAEIWIQGAGNVTAWNSGAYPSGGGGRRSLSGSGEAVFELTDKINADHLKNDYWSWAFRTDWIASGSLEWKEAKVEAGTVFSKWSPALEDTQEQIDSKADQTLTQEQLNALEAKRLQMETEMKALATLQQVSELETFINNLKKEDLDGRQKIIEITKAIEERVKDIEPIMEYSQKLKFMDTYITQGNGGMIIGANDSTTKVVVTPDRISFQSGGSEVAYISQRMLHIDNGVFTMSLQLGHYITRAHPKNEYVNATYFVK